MALTASFSEVRRDLTRVTDLVMEEGVGVTVFKRNRPAFKIVPVADPQERYLSEAAAADEEYFDVFEALAR